MVVLGLRWHAEISSQPGFQARRTRYRLGSEPRSADGTAGELATLGCRRLAQEYASGCLPELEIQAVAVPRRPAASWHFEGFIDSARKGVWVPGEVVGNSVVNFGAVRTDCIRGAIHCPVCVNQSRLPQRGSFGNY